MTKKERLIIETSNEPLFHFSSRTESVRKKKYRKQTKTFLYWNCYHSITGKSLHICQSLQNVAGTKFVIAMRDDDTGRVNGATSVKTIHTDFAVYLWTFKTLQEWFGSHTSTEEWQKMAKAKVKLTRLLISFSLSGADLAVAWKVEREQKRTLWHHRACLS